MSYAENFHWLRQSFIRVQAADRAVRRLPSNDKRRRVLEHIEAAERALNDLDRDLLETDELMTAQLRVGGV